MRGKNPSIEFDDKRPRAAGQREMTDEGAISGLSKSRPRFAQVFRSSRRSNTRSGYVEKALTRAAEQRVFS
jgi:hypothetical protein